MRDLLSALFAKERRFSHPVVVQMSGVSDLEKLGFITQEDLVELGLREKVAVYFPHSYNFSGELYIVPRERVRVVRHLGAGGDEIHRLRRHDPPAGAPRPNLEEDVQPQGSVPLDHTETLRLIAKSCRVMPDPFVSKSSTRFSTFGSLCPNAGAVRTSSTPIPMVDGVSAWPTPLSWPGTAAIMIL